MRLCLANPTWRTDHEKGIRSGCRVPNSIGQGQHTFLPFPFTLAYAMSVVEKEAGVTACILDAIAEDLTADVYVHRVAQFHPDLVVSEMATQSHFSDLELARRVKDRTGAKIALCGSHPTALAEEILSQNPFVDYILLGEYEMTLLDLTRSLRDGESTEFSEGLAYRKAEGTIYVGPKRALIEDLSSLPYPHRDTLPMHMYRVAGFPPPTLFMYASRGCPYRCTFCVWPQWFKSGSYRARTGHDVVDEIEYAVERYGPFKSIYFDDDTFNLGRQRMRDMATAFKERKMNLPWGSHARPDQFDEEMMKNLSEAGLFNIRIGVESGDPEILRRIKKNLDLATVQPCIDLAHKYGVKVHVTFTIGLSGESWQSVKRTVRFAKSITPDSIAFTVTTPFPGTEYYDEVVREGLLETRDWDKYNVTNSAVVRTATMTSAEILKAEKYVMRNVYYSPSYVYRRLRYSSSPSEVFALVKKGASLLLGRF